MQNNVRHAKTTNRGFIALLVTIGWCTHAAAGQGMNFEFEIKQQEPRLEDKTVLNIDSIGLRFGEIEPSSALRLDLFLGRLVADRRDATQISTFRPDGYYIGVELRAETADTRRIRAGASVNLSYNATNQDHSTQDRLELDWRQAEARLWLSLQLGQRLKAYSCAAAVDIEGDQRHTISGTTTVTDLKIDKHGGYCGGLELAMPDEGFIGIEAGGQSLRGGRLYFGKRF